MRSTRAGGSPAVALLTSRPRSGTIYACHRVACASTDHPARCVAVRCRVIRPDLEEQRAGSETVDLVAKLALPARAGCIGMEGSLRGILVIVAQPHLRRRWRKRPQLRPQPCAV